MKPRWPISFILFSICCAVLACWAGLALAADGSAAPSPSAGPPTGLDGSTNSVSEALSPGVNDILKMADAGVSPDVIKTYVECSLTPCQPTQADLIALKQHKVPDEIATLLLKRGAEARIAASQARATAMERIKSTRAAASGGFDPESYDYFQYHYLQPRALASTYERLYPYYYPPYFYSYRFGPVLRFP